MAPSSNRNPIDILGPPDHFLRLLYGALQISFFSCNMGGPSQISFIVYYMGPSPADQFLCML